VAAISRAAATEIGTKSAPRLFTYYHRHANRRRRWLRDWLRSRLNWERTHALYYFDLRDEDKLVSDEEGTELSSMDEVQNEAAYALADMLRD